MMLVNAEKALAPWGFLEHWDTFRAITAGRSARSARLLVGSMLGSLRKRNRLPRSLCQPSSFCSLRLSGSFRGRSREMISHLSSQSLGLGGKVHCLSPMVCLPKLHRFS